MQRHFWGDQPRQASIANLGKTLQLRDGDDFRSTDLVATFEPLEVNLGNAMCFAQGWHFFVCDAFQRALDIHWTDRRIDGVRTQLLTQGSRFHFDGGDTIYDSPFAYRTWTEALKHINVCLDVIQGTPARPASTEGRLRNSGFLLFDILVPNDDQSRLVVQGRRSMTQDQFVEYLITGVQP